MRDRASAAAAAAAATCLHDKHEDPEIELFAFDEQRPVDVAAGHNEYENNFSSAALPCLQATARRTSSTAAAAQGNMRMSLLPPLLVGLQMTAAQGQVREATGSTGGRGDHPLCPWRLLLTRCAAEELGVSGAAVRG